MRREVYLTRWVIRDAAIAEARERGAKISHLAERFDLSKNRIYEILRDAGSTAPQKPPKLSIKKRNNEIRLAYCNGKTVEQLTKEYDLTEWYIKNKILSRRAMRKYSNYLVKNGKVRER